MSGVDKIHNSTLSFNFRDKIYIAERNSGVFVLKRISEMKEVQIEDQLSNQGFQRLINSRPSIVADSMAVKYIESINSV
ncbi:MAG: deoxyribose-phosphate aldolase, partial [Flavobacterium sp.]|nr:deoxyribose-phosphate aldolase [Flavobacterium sp.]